MEKNEKQGVRFDNLSITVMTLSTAIMAGLFLFLRTMETGSGSGGFTGNFLYTVLAFTCLAGGFYAISMAIGITAMFLTDLADKRLMLKILYVVVGLTVLFVVATAGTGLIARTVETIRSESDKPNSGLIDQAVTPQRYPHLFGPQRGWSDWTEDQTRSRPAADGLAGFSHEHVDYRSADGASSMNEICLLPETIPIVKITQFVFA